MENCTAKLSRYDTSIVLMHDSAAKSTTVEALPQIIETILAMEDTVILPITENTQPVHHTIKKKNVPKEEQATEEPEAGEKTKEETVEKEDSKIEDIKVEDTKKEAQEKQPSDEKEEKQSKNQEEN